MYRNLTAGPSIAGYRIGHTAAALMVACVAFAALPGPAAAMQALEAADHAELEAAVSATGVSRVALANDRIRRVIRSPGGFDVEHDAASGDLYLRPAEGPDQSLDEPPDAALPVTLFLGTERGFTYRLTLTPDARRSAQVLIRNAAAADAVGQVEAGPTHDARVAELVRLVRAVARRERLPGYVVEPASGRRAIGIWRGARFTAQVLAAGPGTEAAALARRFGTGVAAIWVASPPGSTDRERIAVVVMEPGRAGVAR
ncbi:MAG: type-F conjugative transfer system secretin TraK [Rhodospirillales bacterium]|nr:type-F conjugative transfer system secretin TraK [Rhodospirillales bacterium]